MKKGIRIIQIIMLAGFCIFLLYITEQQKSWKRAFLKTLCVS